MSIDLGIVLPGGSIFNPARQEWNHAIVHASSPDVSDDTGVMVMVSLAVVRQTAVHLSQVTDGASLSPYVLVSFGIALLGNFDGLFGQPRFVTNIGSAKLTKLCLLSMVVQYQY